MKEHLISIFICSAMKIYKRSRWKPSCTLLNCVFLVTMISCRLCAMLSSCGNLSKSRISEQSTLDITLCKQVLRLWTMLSTEGKVWRKRLTNCLMRCRYTSAQNGGISCNARYKLFVLNQYIVIPQIVYTLFSMAAFQAYTQSKKSHPVWQHIAFC